MVAKDSIFREYDIRGTVGIDFDADLAYFLGRALAKKIRAASGAESDSKKASSLKVAVGYDCRLSADELRHALMSGLRVGGVSVIDTGMGPTPQLYYAVNSRKLAGGIMVTASHNPGEQNGFKMMVGLSTLSGKDIQELQQLVRCFEELGESTAPQPPADCTIETIDMREAYLQELIARSKGHMGSRRLKVVVDGGNGVGGLIGPDLLRGLGCEVIEIFTDPDGRFPNHHPDPTVLENIVDLRKRVVLEKADLGIAWDGDADRIGVVDEVGNPIFGDMLVVLYGRQLLKEVAKPTIIGDVKCSELMFSDLEKKGATTVMSKTGHSLIKAKLKELHAELAGEMSGHIFFAHRYYGFDDAMHASARLVEIVSSTNIPVSHLLADLPKMVNTPEIRVDCPDNIKFAVAESAKTAFPEFKTSTLDGVRIAFKDGWGLVRASNTQPALVMRFEAETPGLLAEYQKLVEERICVLRSAMES